MLAIPHVRCPRLAHSRIQNSWRLSHVTQVTGGLFLVVKFKFKIQLYHPKFPFKTYKSFSCLLKVNEKTKDFPNRRLPEWRRGEFNISMVRACPTLYQPWRQDFTNGFKGRIFHFLSCCLTNDAPLWWYQKTICFNFDNFSIVSSSPDDVLMLKLVKKLGWSEG